MDVVKFLLEKVAADICDIDQVANDNDDKTLLYAASSVRICFGKLTFFFFKNPIFCATVYVACTGRSIGYGQVSGRGRRQSQSSRQ